MRVLNDALRPRFGTPPSAVRGRALAARGDAAGRPLDAEMGQ